jgi:hypothetical protein
LIALVEPWQAGFRGGSPAGPATSSSLSYLVEQQWAKDTLSV